MSERKRNKDPFRVFVKERRTKYGRLFVDLRDGGGLAGINRVPKVARYVPFHFTFNLFPEQRADYETKVTRDFD